MKLSRKFNRKIMKTKMSKKKDRNIHKNHKGMKNHQAENQETMGHSLINNCKKEEKKLLIKPKIENKLLRG